MLFLDLIFKNKIVTKDDHNYYRTFLFVVYIKKMDDYIMENVSYFL